MNISYRVTGPDRASLQNEANRILHEFIGPDAARASYGMEIDAQPYVQQDGRQAPVLWQAEVTVSNIRTSGGQP